jgi:hypothetical protein
MEKTKMGIMIDVDNINTWEDATMSAKVLLDCPKIQLLAYLENADECSSLIVNALRRIAERTCTLIQAQRVISSVFACWDVIGVGPGMWYNAWYGTGISHLCWKRLIAACRDVVTEKRAAYENNREEGSSKPCNCEACVAARNGYRPSQTVRVRTKKANENPLKNYRVQVKRTSYGELVIPAYNEEDALAIATGNKRMYDGSWASEHFTPMSSDTYLDVCDGDDAITEVKGGAE